MSEVFKIIVCVMVLIQTVSNVRTNYTQVSWPTGIQALPSSRYPHHIYHNQCADIGFQVKIICLKLCIVIVLKFVDEFKRLYCEMWLIFSFLCKCTFCIHDHLCSQGTTEKNIVRALKNYSMLCQLTVFWLHTCSSH